MDNYRIKELNYSCFKWVFLFIDSCLNFTGNHASYNLQAFCDEDKKKWVEVLQKVFEALQLA